MGYIVQCSRKNNNLVAIAKWEQCMVRGLGNSPNQKKFLNFRITNIQAEKLLESQKINKIKVDTQGLVGKTALGDWATGKENIKIQDLRGIPNWYDFVIETKKDPIEEVLHD
jgi:hypothetical protein